MNKAHHWHLLMKGPAWIYFISISAYFWFLFSMAASLI